MSRQEAFVSRLSRKFKARWDWFLFLSHLSCDKKNALFSLKSLTMCIFKICKYTILYLKNDIIYRLFRNDFKKPFYESFSWWKSFYKIFQYELSLPRYMSAKIAKKKLVFIYLFIIITTNIIIYNFFIGLKLGIWTPFLIFFCSYLFCSDILIFFNYVYLQKVETSKICLLHLKTLRI